MAGFWEFPGGKILPGERPIEAAEREAREETGLLVRATKLLAEISSTDPAGPSLLYFFHCHLLGEGNPRSPFRWAALSELDELNFPKANHTVIRFLSQRS